MLLFGLGSLATIAALAGAGYSHYRYRVKHNQMYLERFGKR